MWNLICKRHKFFCHSERRSIADENVYKLFIKHNVAEPAAEEYLWALVDVWRLLESVPVTGEGNTVLITDLYGKMTDQRTAADEFYWQVFPVITTAEAFIFYISVGSGALPGFSDGRKLVATVGIVFVLICWYSFYVNKTKLDTYTKRLFWLEVLTGRPQLHAASIMQTSERRCFSTTLFDAWQTFFVFLIACHVVSIVWMVQQGVQWWILSSVPLYALAPDLYGMCGYEVRWRQGDRYKSTRQCLGGGCSLRHCGCMTKQSV
jgi:hypothetical protein